MENSTNSYVRTDNNKIINERCIVWVKKNGRLFKSLFQVKWLQYFKH